MVVTALSHRQGGLSLIEMTIAIIISVVVMLSLTSMVGVATQSARAGHAVNELHYSASFALDRIADRARAVPQRPLTTPLANTTGDLFAPTGCSGSACVMFCLNTTDRKLIETVITDTACSGAGVVASRVSNFNAALPAMGPLDRHGVIITLGLDDLSGGTLSQTMHIRVGGGLK